VTLTPTVVPPVMMVSDVDSAADQHIIADIDSLNAGDVDALRKRNPIPNGDQRLELLVIESGYGVKPEIPLCIDPGSKMNEPGPEYTATRTEIEAGGMKQPA